MKSALDYRPATLADVAFLAPRLRPADRAEILAASGLTPEIGLEVSFAASERAVTACHDGRPVGMFGVVPTSLLGGEGTVWALGTSELERHARAWLRDAPEWIAWLGDGYRVLRNRVDARNVAHVAWIRRMGFTLEPGVLSGPAGMMFLPFSLEVSPPCV